MDIFLLSNQKTKQTKKLKFCIFDLCGASLLRYRFSPFLPEEICWLSRIRGPLKMGAILNGEQLCKEFIEKPSKYVNERVVSP